VETICFLPVKVNNNASRGDQIKPFPLSSVIYPFFARCCLSVWFWLTSCTKKNYVNVRTMMCSSLQKKNYFNTNVYNFTHLALPWDMGSGRAVVKFISMPWMITACTCMYVAKLGRKKQLNQVQNSCVVKLQHKTSELQILYEEINRSWLSFYASEIYRKLIESALMFQGKSLVTPVYIHNFNR